MAMRHKSIVEIAWISRSKLFANVLERRVNSVEFQNYCACDNHQYKDGRFLMVRMTIDSGPLESHLC